MAQDLESGPPDVCPFADEEAFGLVGLLGDDLATRYRPLAADEHLIDGQRQAAMQLSVAEDHLCSGQPAECEAAAAEALALFRGTSDEHGVVDSLRLLLQARRSQTGVAGARPEAVPKPAAEELARRRESNKLSGIFCLRVFLAEIRVCDARGAQNLRLAEKLIEEALSTALEKRDKRTEAFAYHVLADAYFRLGRYGAMLDACSQAVELSREVGDRLCEARALYGIAFAHAMTNDFKAALARSKEPRALFQRLGTKRAEAATLLLVARLHLLLEEPQRALPLAQRALAHCRAARCERAAALLGNALDTVVECLFATAKGKQATRLVDEVAEEHHAAGSVRGLVAALLALSAARLQQPAAPERALEAAEAALEAAKDFGEARLQLRALGAVGRAQLRMGRANQAAQSLWDAGALARQLRDPTAEALAVQAMARVYLLGGELEAATEAAEAARARCQDAELDLATEAGAVLVLARGRLLQGQGALAVQLAQQALGCYQEACRPRGQAAALQLLVEMQEAAQDLDEALQSAESWLELLARLGKNGPRAVALQRVASLHFGRGDAAEAEKLAFEGLALCQAVGDKRTEAQLHILLMQIFVSHLQAFEDGQEALEASPAALDLHCRAMQAADAAGALAEQHLAEDKGLCASASFWCANVLSWGSDPEATLQALTRAADLYGEAGDVRGQASALVSGADLHLALGQRELAFCSADLALELARDCGDQHLRDAASAALERMHCGFWKPGETGGPGEEATTVADKLLGMIRKSMPHGCDVSMDSPLADLRADAFHVQHLISEVNREFHLELGSWDFCTVRELEQHIQERAEILAAAY